MEKHGGEEEKKELQRKEKIRNDRNHRKKEGRKKEMKPSKEEFMMRETKSVKVLYNTVNR